MKKYKSILLVIICALFTSNVFSQTPAKSDIKNVKIVPVNDQPTLADAIKMISDLQKSNAQLQSQLNALQTQVNANYKAQDFMIGTLVKKTDGENEKINSITASITSQSQTAFVVTAGNNNLADVFSPATNYLSGTYYRSVIIDNAACNNNPQAIIIVISQSSGFGYNLPVPLAVAYDKKINKWKIVINPNGTNSMVTGLAKPTQGNGMVGVAEFYPYQINAGDKFNVEVFK